MQAAPRQSRYRCSPIPRRPDAPRAGSAEAKFAFLPGICRPGGCTPCRQRRGKALFQVRKAVRVLMHPVQAAPRQRPTMQMQMRGNHDAPRAGSAEAKPPSKGSRPNMMTMHPVQAAPRQRQQNRHLTHSPRMHPVQAAPRQSACPLAPISPSPRCTPCRQRRGKDRLYFRTKKAPSDAPRAGSAEAKVTCHILVQIRTRCTPCRQRRGKDLFERLDKLGMRMHPVQAAPRQSCWTWRAWRSAHRCTPCRQRRGKVLSLSR